MLTVDMSSLSHSRSVRSIRPKTMSNFDKKLTVHSTFIKTCTQTPQN